MISAKQDPTLECLRNSVLNRKSDLETDGLNLAKACQNIHSSYLFYPEGRPALKQICILISSTDAGINSPINSWKDLANCLGLTFHQMGCIENYKSDNTELVLKTYAQRKDATMDIVIKAFLELERLDVISSIKPCIEELVDYAKRSIEIKAEEGDGGYCSKSHGNSNDGILRPKGYKFLCHELPITLKDLMTIEGIKESTISEIESNSFQTEVIQKSSVIRQHRHSQRKCSKRVMVTFAKDGETIAREIAYEFRRPKNGNLPIGVLILDEHPDKVNSNPERFITHMFSKMDFIIPIVTEGYLEALGKKPDWNTSWASCIDPLYVQLIHDLMSKYYCRNQCRNDKIRCIIPNEQLSSVMAHPHKKLDPILNIFFKQSEVNDLIFRILKFRRTLVH